MAGLLSKNKYVRFFAKVNTHGFDHSQCWQWIGGGKGNGYGHTSYLGKNIGAHRLAYTLLIGDVPPGMDVCHICDNRNCVNPDHLTLGTRKENMQDMAAKGRGAGCHKKHLKEYQIQEIKRRLAAGISAKEVSDALGVPYGRITSIKRGDSYVGISE